MNCQICNDLISLERAEAITTLGLSKICLTCAHGTVKPVKGIFVGMSGVSPLILTNNIGEEEHIAPVTPFIEYDSIENTEEDETD